MILRFDSLRLIDFWSMMQVRLLLVVMPLLLNMMTMIGQNPNIILIMTDDQGWFDVGFNGNLMIQTPNLDALASRGIIFDRFYSASPVCSPTRGSVMTGRNPYRLGIPDANVGHLKQEELTIAELLKKEGYATGHFGKWHLGTLTRKQLDANRGGKKINDQHFTIPTEHGYDQFFCTESKVPTYDPLIYPTNFSEGESKRYGWKALANRDSGITFGTAYWVENEKQEDQNLTGDDTKIIMDRVITFIRSAKESSTPFFTTVWTHTPHLPVVTSEAYMSKYEGFTHQQKLYYGSITALDDQIGRLWDELVKLGIEKNTMIWFCSDNGPESKTPGSAGKYRGRKRSLYEGGLRTPAFLVWGDKIAPGQRSDFPAVTSDYLPSILGALDVNYPDDRTVDGINILPHIGQSKSIERTKPIGFRYKDQISWVTHQYKLISQDQGKNYELYNLLEDPYEVKNIAGDQKALVVSLKMDLDKWLAGLPKE